MYTSTVVNEWDWLRSKVLWLWTVHDTNLIFSALSGNRSFFSSVTFRSKSIEKEAKSFSRIWSKMIQNTVMLNVQLMTWNGNINDFHSFNLQPFDWPTFHGRAETCQSKIKYKERKRKSKNKTLHNCCDVYKCVMHCRWRDSKNFCQ